MELDYKKIEEIAAAELIAIESHVMKAPTENLSVQAGINAAPAYGRGPPATKSVSFFVLLICVFSLVVSFSTEFSIINRFVSVIVAFMAAGFYLIGTMLDKKNGGPTGNDNR